MHLFEGSGLLTHTKLATKIPIFLAVLAVVGPAPMRASACVARDFMTVAVPQNSAMAGIDALVIAYDDLHVAPDGSAIGLDGQDWLDVGTMRDVPAKAMLRDPTILEQFTHVYPLAFDLTQRLVPFVDPGRLRNASLFEALYFQTEQAARDSLVTVTEPALSQASFRVTQKRNVACQLSAALAALVASGEDYSDIFHGAGGGFNWRVIAGTTRLSTHSFGIAFDVNAELGKYWLWTGAKEGAVGAYDNVIPENLVRTFERFGFIWGGKWHHFDGMHFEYRPELILHSRIVSP